MFQSHFVSYFSLFFEGPILIAILYCPLLTLEKDGHASKKDTLWFWYWNIHHFVDRLSFYMTIPNWLKEVQDSLGFHGKGVASKIAGVADTYRRKARDGLAGRSKTWCPGLKSRWDLKDGAPQWCLFVYKPL